MAGWNSRSLQDAKDWQRVCSFFFKIPQDHVQLTECRSKTADTDSNVCKWTIISTIIKKELTCAHWRSSLKLGYLLEYLISSRKYQKFGHGLVFGLFLQHTLLQIKLKGREPLQHCPVFRIRSGVYRHRPWSDNWNGFKLQLYHWMAGTLWVSFFLPVNESSYSLDF